MDQQDLGGLSFPGSSTCHSSQRLFFFFSRSWNRNKSSPRQQNSPFLSTRVWLPQPTWFCSRLATSFPSLGVWFCPAKAAARVQWGERTPSGRATASAATISKVRYKVWLPSQLGILGGTLSPSGTALRVETPGSPRPHPQTTGQCDQETGGMPHTTLRFVPSREPFK